MEVEVDNYDRRFGGNKFGIYFRNGSIKSKKWKVESGKKRMKIKG